MVAERGGQKGESTDVDSLDGRSALRSTAGTHDAGAAGQSAPHMTITWYGQGRPMMPCGLEDTLRCLERVTAVLAVPKWSDATARPFRMARRQGRCVRSQQVPDVGGTHTGEGQRCLPERKGNKCVNEPHDTVDRMAPQEGLNHPRVASSLSPEGVQLLCNRQPASRPCAGDPPTWFWVGHPWSCST